jgi:sugar lactone lactonase YvrE
LVDSQGNLYVGDRGNKRVEEFDKDGKFLRAINVGGAPAELGMDSKGRLYVASDTDSSKVFSPTGEFLGNLSTESSPETTMAIRCMSITPDDVIVAGLEDQITLYQIVDK